MNVNRLLFTAVTLLFCIKSFIAELFRCSCSTLWSSSIVSPNLFFSDLNKYSTVKSAAGILFDTCEHVSVFSKQKPLVIFSTSLVEG